MMSNRCLRNKAAIKNESHLSVSADEAFCSKHSDEQPKWQAAHPTFTQSTSVPWWLCTRSWGCSANEGRGHTNRCSHPGCRWCWWCCATQPPLSRGSASLIGHFSWPTSTYPSLYLSGRVSAPFPGTTAPCPAGRRPELRWRCRCTAPPRLCWLPWRRDRGSGSVEQK